MRMTVCFFVTDLHGRIDRYEKLLAKALEERPAALFIGGDLLPSHLGAAVEDGAGSSGFLRGYLAPRFRALCEELGSARPRIFLILGNDDPGQEEAVALDGGAQGIWEYVHLRRVPFGEFAVYGYSCIPPSPYDLKDWERYDVSRFVDPGCVAPEDGSRTIAVSRHEASRATIRKDLATLTAGYQAVGEIFLFHVPPYATSIDLADLAGRRVDQVPLDPHVGSIAVRQLIEERQPVITLHGHVHESTRLTGTWNTMIGRTICINGAHDGPELALVRFDPLRPGTESRELL